FLLGLRLLGARFACLPRGFLTALIDLPVRCRGRYRLLIDGRHGLVPVHSASLLSGGLPRKEQPEQATCRERIAAELARFAAARELPPVCRNRYNFPVLPEGGHGREHPGLALPAEAGPAVVWFAARKGAIRCASSSRRRARAGMYSPSSPSA